MVKLVQAKETALRHMGQKLRDNAYPGRGIVVGLNSTGRKYVQVYWTMGRSANSRNRVMVVEDGEVKTVPHDPSKCTDPSLIIYTAMKTVGWSHIVSNGDQTDTIATALVAGGSFESALLSRQHEPDSPTYTPRISAMVELGDASPRVKLSRICKSPFGDSESYHVFHQIGRFEKGLGYCFHTYEHDGNPPRPFRRDPYLVRLDGTIDDIAHEYWHLLNQENRVALAVKSIEIDTGTVEHSIVNALA